MDFAANVKTALAHRPMADEVYALEVKTGLISRASRDAKIWIILYGGEDGKALSPKRWLKGGQLQPGSTDTFEVSFPSDEVVGILSKVVVGYDNADTNTGWFLDYVSRHNITQPITEKYME